MKTIAIILGLLAAYPAFAKTTGADLLLGCRLATGAATPADENDLFAFQDCATRLEVLIGVMREVAKAAPNSFFAACLPPNVSVTQGIMLTIKWIEAHPDKMHIDSTVIAAQSLRDAFPCSAK